MHKILKIVLVVVGLIGAGLWFMLPDSNMPAAQAAQSGPMNAMFMITYLLLAVGVIVSLMFTLKNLFSDPKGLKKTLFVAVGFLLVVAISYVMSSGTDVSEDFMAMSDESTVKKIGMGLNVFFILTVIAVVAIILPGIKKLFSK
ncbi:MAG: hypothetical protein KAJ23_06415 [Maribacter sp.]|nr:hypothetical protein [Maribacter sp.]